MISGSSVSGSIESAAEVSGLVVSTEGVTGKPHAAKETNSMIKNIAKRNNRFMMIAFLYV